MSKVSVVAKLTAQDGKRADLVAGMDTMMDHVETEDGTLKYILMEDAADENVVWLYEEYSDQAALDAHGGSNVMKALGGAIGPFLAGRPELSFCKPVRGKGLRRASERSVAATYLDGILARHREVAAADTRPIEPLLDAARAMPPARGFTAALAGRARLGVIAEIKRRSPSKGDLNADLDPAALAVEYERGGAACLSVLTDGEGFGGSAADLAAARAACVLPVLRKDFTVGELDVVDARLMGADCVLLIAAALDRAELVAFHSLATDIGLDVLVEIHDEAELGDALEAEATLIGVNQRDLVTFEVDHDRAARMAGVIPDASVKVAESGVRGGADARALDAAGYDAVLVGETLVTSGDPAAAIAELIG